MLNYCRKDLCDYEDLSKYVDPEEKEIYAPKGARGIDRHEYLHHTMESEYLSRLNKDLGEVFITNCSQIAPGEQNKRQKFFTNIYEQECLEDKFEKEFSHRQPYTMHPKFKTAEEYDLTRGFFEKAHTSREEDEENARPEDLDFGQDYDLLENRDISEEKGIGRVKKVIETL